MTSTRPSANSARCWCSSTGGDWPAALAEGGLARVALARGDLAGSAASLRAVEAFERVVGRRDVRSGPPLWLLRAAVLLRAGDHAGARGWAQRALEASRRYDAPEARRSRRHRRRCRRRSEARASWGFRDFLVRLARACKRSTHSQRPWKSVQGEPVDP